jgi:hypothetical protein
MGELRLAERDIEQGHGLGRVGDAADLFGPS